MSREFIKVRTLSCLPLALIVLFYIFVVVLYYCDLMSRLYALLTYCLGSFLLLFSDRVILEYLVRRYPQVILQGVPVLVVPGEFHTHDYAAVSLTLTKRPVVYISSSTLKKPYVEHIVLHELGHIALRHIPLGYTVAILYIPLLGYSIGELTRSGIVYAPFIALLIAFLLSWGLYCTIEKEAEFYALVRTKNLQLVPAYAHIQHEVRRFLETYRPESLKAQLRLIAPLACIAMLAPVSKLSSPTSLIYAPLIFFLVLVAFCMPYLVLVKVLRADFSTARLIVTVSIGITLFPLAFGLYEAEVLTLSALCAVATSSIILVRIKRPLARTILALSVLTALMLTLVLLIVNICG